MLSRQQSPSADGGSALTEFAAVCCMLVVLTTGFVDLSLLIGERSEMVEGARTAARTAAAFVPDSGAADPEAVICSTAKQLAELHLSNSGLDPANYSIKVGPAVLDSVEDQRAVQVTITKVQSTKLLPGPLFDIHPSGGVAHSSFVFEAGQTLKEPCL